jgi:hypothetical protein
MKWMPRCLDMIIDRLIGKWKDRQEFPWSVMRTFLWKTF